MNGAKRLQLRIGALALIVTLTGCTQGGEPSAAPNSPPAPSTVSASPSAEPSPPKPGSLETPGTSSGSLSQDAFPRPKTLGADWAYAVDSGDAEEGYVGNGTPALERDPEELATLAVPFGCARRAPMPTAEHALEVDYTASGVKVIAIRMQFSDVATARTLFEGRLTNLERCRGRSGGKAIGDLVTTVDRLGEGVVLSDRTPKSDAWVELAILDDDHVVLIAAQTLVGRPPMTRAQAQRLAATFRR